MIRLYKSQMFLLLSKRDLYILLGSLFVFLLFLVYASRYYLDYNYQIVYKDNLFHDYLTESLSFIKFIVVMYGVYFSILVKKLHHLDGLYLSRSNRLRIILSRLLVLISYMMVCISILFVLFLLVGTFLTPIMKEYDYLSLYGSILLFGLFYLLIGYILMITIRVYYAPIFTILFYFTGTIFSPYYINIKQATLFEKVISFVINDLIVFSNNTISPYYGNIHLGALVFLLFWIVVCLFHEKDIITL